MAVQRFANDRLAIVDYPHGAVVKALDDPVVQKRVAARERTPETLTRRAGFAAFGGIDLTNNLSVDGNVPLRAT